MHEVVAHQRAICRRKRDSRRVDLRADAAAFENMSEVLHESVADVDRGRRGPDRGEALAGIQPRMRTAKSIDEIFSGGAIFFRVAAYLQLARQDARAERRVAERAGHEDLVAGTRRIPPHHASPGLANQRDRDRQLARVRDIAAHDIGGSLARRPAQSGVNAIERPCCNSVAHSQVHDACHWPSAHRRDVAQVDRERARAERISRSPAQIEMNIFDQAVDRKQYPPPRPRQNRAIVAGPEQGARADANSCAQSCDQFEFAGEFARGTDRPAHGSRAFSGCSSSGNSATSVKPRRPSANWAGILPPAASVITRAIYSPSLRTESRLPFLFGRSNSESRSADGSGGPLSVTSTTIASLRSAARRSSSPVVILAIE